MVDRYNTTQRWWRKSNRSCFTALRDQRRMSPPMLTKHHLSFFIHPSAFIWTGSDFSHFIQNPSLSSPPSPHLSLSLWHLLPCPPPHVSGPSVSSSTCSCLSLMWNNATPLQVTSNIQEASPVLSVPGFHSTSPALPHHFALLDLFW